MENDFVLKQTKEITMTSDRTVSVFTESLEKVDAVGNRQMCGYHRVRKVKRHNAQREERRAA